ncbi:hypothetical protein [Ectothiorhodospira mobilis]|uniref:hypothetical protein n=1 Tax=Ectothiorhodospira mobilis TaxID=195064 RepID=UPI001903E0DB|nr:hypothetical protein [Ectothiorhodospira mobilis]MBK1691109.1 hypothetical protein [Ectothiorhodospira mobilis]
MIPIHQGKVVRLVDRKTRVVDLIREQGRALVWRRKAVSRRAPEDGPATAAEAANARREAEYVSRRNGVKPALLQLWRV